MPHHTLVDVQAQACTHDVSHHQKGDEKESGIQVLHVYPIGVYVHVYVCTYVYRGHPYMRYPLCSRGVLAGACHHGRHKQHDADQVHATHDDDEGGVAVEQGDEKEHAGDDSQHPRHDHEPRNTRTQRPDAGDEDGSGVHEGEPGGNLSRPHPQAASHVAHDANDEGGGQHELAHVPLITEGKEGQEETERTQQGKGTTPVLTQLRGDRVDHPTRDQGHDDQDHHATTVNANEGRD